MQTFDLTVVDLKPSLLICLVYSLLHCNSILYLLHSCFFLSYRNTCIELLLWNLLFLFCFPKWLVEELHVFLFQ